MVLVSLRNLFLVLLIVFSLAETVFSQNHNESVCPEFGGTMCHGSDMSLTGCSKYCDCSGYGSGYSSFYGGVMCETPLCYQSDTDSSLTDIDYFDSYVCSNNGECVDTNDCKCKQGFMGYKCQYSIDEVFCFNIHTNNTEVCSGRGRCWQPDACNCNKGYEGPNCELFRCYGYLSSDQQACSGKGKCVDWNNCDCDNGNSGSNCEFVSSAGSSVQRVCFGIQHTNTSVCNNRGICTGLDSCVCQFGYFGTECELSYCFSIPQNDTRVCNGRGYCNKKDMCDCISPNSNVLVSGRECELVQCKGSNDQYYYSTDFANVCSGNGICTISGCNCSKGYSGEFCQEYSCFGISKSNPYSCSGHGVCSSPDSCSCHSNSTNGFWTGTDCNVCDPSHSGSECLTSVGSCDRYEKCSGQGNCSVNNTCICDEGFKGEYCDECANNRYGWDCSQECSRSLTCLGHGECSRDGQFCECDNSPSSGYWKGSNCSSCVDGYYGDNCQTKVGSKYEFNLLGNEIFFELDGPSIQSGSIVDCSKLLSPSSYTAVGSLAARCIYKTPLFPSRISIELASLSTIKPSDALDVNTKVFDSQNLPRFIITLSNSPTTISSPDSEIVFSNSLVRYTENLILIGRNRLGIARERTLYYEWSLVSSTYSFNALSNLVSSGSGLGNNILNVSTSDLPANNVFTIQLKIKHPDFNLWSSPVIANFTKEDQPIIQSQAKKYEFYVYPKSTPLMVTLSVAPVKIPFEIFEDGIKKDTTLYTVNLSFEPDILDSNSNSIFIPDLSVDGVISLDADFYNMRKTPLVTVKCDVVDSNIILISTSFNISYVPIYKPSLSISTLDSGVSIRLKGLNGRLIQQFFWECTCIYGDLGSCGYEFDSLIYNATNSDSLFIPKNIENLYDRNLKVRVFLAGEGFHYRVQESLNTNGFNFIKIEDGTSNPVLSISNHIVINRSQNRYKFFFETLPLLPNVTLSDEKGNVISVQVQNDNLEFFPSSIPAQSSFLTMKFSFLNESTGLEFKKDMFGYVDSMPKSNCSFIMNEQQIYVPVFNGILNFYNITTSCDAVSYLPTVHIILKNQNTELVVCERAPLVYATRSCYIFLPDTIGLTEVFADIISGTDVNIAFLPVATLSERVHVGYLKESLNNPSSEIASIQQLLYQYFISVDPFNTSIHLQDIIKKLLVLHYPEKELSYSVSR